LPAYFFDSSGIVKRYVNEIGSGWVTGILSLPARNSIHVARITAVEVVSAITRRQRSGGYSAASAASLLASFRHDLAMQYQLVAITPRLLTSAMALTEKHALRGYDAVQLAAAMQVNRRRRSRRASALTVVTADVELNAAAVAEGLLVEDPNLHP
jgi:predicted nucleic acid-binding protein